MARGWYMEAGRRVDSGWGVWSKLEGKRSQLENWQSQQLHAWYCELDETAIMKTAASMIPEFLRLHSALCQMTGLDENRDLVLRILGKVL